MLDVDELLNLIEGEKNEQVKKEAMGLLDTIDIDKDGKVVKEEWQKAFGAIYDMM